MDEPRNNLTYDEACHAMQTGVAFELERGLNNAATPKHLRVGVNSAMVNDAALVRLLCRKGLITADEYMEEVRLEMNREVDRYEDTMRAVLGANFSLR